MLTITLPDNSTREYAAPLTVAEFASDIGAGLAKAALAGRVNGKLVDTSYRLESDAAVAIVTGKDPDGLEVLRHSTAHLLAQAVKKLFPSAQVTIGPVIENGFYYDFAFERSFTPDDIVQIESAMAALATAQLPVKREVWPREKAVEFFLNIGEKYKAEIISDLPAAEPISLYQQGDFIDLCRGPHVPHTGFLQAFKLTKLAGAYWRGDPKNEMLQRIYGTAWPDQKALKVYLDRLEEAEKRDHRRIGKIQDLFHFQEEAPGNVFWHENGWKLFLTLQDYIRSQLSERDYIEVNTPELVDRSLWEKSGHWEKFGKDMFVTETEQRLYAIKPMNCPCHIQIFNQGLKSYRDLPIRMAEFGSCHRNEASGTLHGLMRVRHMTQDDAHIFCTPDQVQSEASAFIDLLLTIYRDFGFDNLILKLALRPEQRFGDDALWDKAEDALAKALDGAGLAWQPSPGEGAFYGPKIEFSLRDSLDRVWQCGTLQLDYVLPERLQAVYIAEDSSKQTPVVLHRAAFGSFERFIGILIEHYAGKLPLWLAPVQLMIMSITDRHADYARFVCMALKKQGIRARLDLRNEKVGFKIREHTLRYIPYQAVIGDQEVQTGTVALRALDGSDCGRLTIDECAKRLIQEVQSKGKRQK
ncbi:MAG: threonine--tRNA ligase [Gammaproteobacteria bacterium]|nr:threonine--tRNA ligase [Gammaproteobacteria bacterium]